MSYIQGFNRDQAVLIPETIEQLIAESNPVRFIDAFVNSQDIVSFGLKILGLIKMVDHHFTQKIY